jgi:hypothetical protein
LLKTYFVEDTQGWRKGVKRRRGTEKKNIGDKGISGFRG